MDAIEHSNSDRPFSKWRERLWPVHYHESKKVFLLLLLKFCVSFNYSILHATKDTLIVTKGSGAEAIPILKGWFVLVFAFLFMLLYSKLSNHLSRPALFYITIMPFLFFFALYGFFLYPNRDWLSPHATADWLLTFVGKERAYWIVVYRYWMDSIFFLMAELWGGIVIALLFWGFANRINTVNQASRFYTILSAGGHVGIITAGPIIWHYAAQNQFLITIQYLMGFVTIVNLLIILTYWLMNRHDKAKNFLDDIKENDYANKKPKLSLIDSLAYVIRSPNLGCIALMVIGYSISVNMVEVLWKATLKLKYPNANEYQAFMGIVSSMTGLLSLFLALFVGGNIIRTFGWYFGAQLTPIILGIASVVFLGVYFSGYSYEGLPLIVNSASLTALVVCGAIHNIACKSMKYCLFDPTKEMTYIPLDEEAKVKGKAAVDVVASRFGKSGSSWIQVSLMELTEVSSVLSVASYLAPFILFAVVSWMIAVYFLRYHFKMDIQAGAPIQKNILTQTT